MTNLCFNWGHHFRQRFSFGCKVQDLTNIFCKGKNQQRWEVFHWQMIDCLWKTKEGIVCQGVLLCECLVVLCLTLLFTFTECLSGQDVQSTVYQTDEHVFAGLQADSAQNSFLAVKCSFSTSCLVSEKSREDRTGRGRAGANTSKVTKKTTKFKKWGLKRSHW